MELPELKGYLRKKSRQDRWQRRYFEATTHYLTYYKSRESEKLLACIDLWRTQNIELNPNDPDKLEFSIAIGEQSYLLKADSQDDAQKWIKGLRSRQHRPENAPSEVFSLRSERYDAESDASSEHGGRRPGYASSDTGSVGSRTSRQSLGHPPVHTTYTDSALNPLVPNANAINAGKYPMLKTDQAIQKQKDEDNINSACCCGYTKGNCYKKRKKGVEMGSSDEDERKKRSINEMFGDDSNDSDDDDDQIRPVSTNTTTAAASGLFGSDSESDDDNAPPKRVAPPPSKRVKSKSSSSSSNRKAQSHRRTQERMDSGDEYDSGEEATHTREDDDFIDKDDDLADVLGEYDQEQQRFDDERPMDEPRESTKTDDFFDETLKSLKTGRRSKMNLSAQEMEQITQEVLYRMDKAHADDVASIAEKKPALEKIKYVDHALHILRKVQFQPMLLDFDLLSIIKKWIQPLENGSLPNVGVRTKMLQMVNRMPVFKEHLKRSGFGKVVMTLWKHPQETQENKELCRDMIERWSRSVFNKTMDFSKLAELEAEKAETAAYRGQEMKRKQKQAVDNRRKTEHNGNVFQSRNPDDMDTKAEVMTGSERAALPQQLKFDFLHRPRSKVEIQNVPKQKADSDSRKARLAKRMQEIAKPGKKSKRAMSVSIEGR